MEPRFQIIDGPSLLHMMFSLTIGTSSSYNRSEVQFSVIDTLDEKRHVVKGCVDGMSREDGSGNCWLIQVFISVGGRHFRTEGFFNTKTRHGWLKDAGD